MILTLGGLLGELVELSSDYEEIEEIGWKRPIQIADHSTDSCLVSGFWFLGSGSCSFEAVPK